MAAKVGLQSEDQRDTQRVRRCVAEYLVRHLLAIQISKYLYRRLKVRAVKEVSSNPRPSEIYENKPSESVRGGILRWEPPKHKRDLKPHPWRDLIAAGR